MVSLTFSETAPKEDATPATPPSSAQVMRPAPALGHRAGSSMADDSCCNTEAGALMGAC